VVRDCAAGRGGWLALRVPNEICRETRQNDVEFPPTDLRDQRPSRFAGLKEFGAEFAY